MVEHQKHLLTRWLEDGYVTLLILGMTQGPVFQIWWVGAAQQGFDTRSAVAASHLLLQLPALVLLGKYFSWRNLPRFPLTMLLTAFSWLALSSLWATLSVVSVVESLSLVTTIGVAVYLVSRFSLTRLLTQVLMAMQIGIAWSLFAIASDWDRALGEDGVWVGIYFNRNSLAPPAAVGCIAAISLFFLRRFPRKGLNGIIPPLSLAIVVLVDGYVLVKTESQTALYGAMIGLAIAAAGQFRFLNQPISSESVATRLSSWVLVSLASVIPWAHVFAQHYFPDTFRPVDFNGREAIWEFVYNGFAMKPIIGWGWMSAWSTPEFLRLDQWWLWEGKLAGPYSHSAFLDILLGGGVAGGVLFVTAVIAALRFHVQPHLGNSHLIATWLTMFVLISASQESFLVGNHFMLVLLVVGLLIPCVASGAYGSRQSA